MAVPCSRRGTTSLSRETFCSGETHAGPSMGCRPWCQLCALRCGPTFHGPTDLGTPPRRCRTGVFSVGFQVWCSPGHRGVLCYYPWVGSPHCLCGACVSLMPQNQLRCTRRATPQGCSHPAAASKQLRKCHRRHTKQQQELRSGGTTTCRAPRDFHGMAKLPLHHCKSPPVCCKYPPAAESHTPPLSTHLH